MSLVLLHDDGLLFQQLLLHLLKHLHLLLYYLSLLCLINSLGFSGFLEDWCALLSRRLDYYWQRCWLWLLCWSAVSLCFLRSRGQVLSGLNLRNTSHSYERQRCLLIQLRINFDVLAIDTHNFRAIW